MAAIKNIVWGVEVWWGGGGCVLSPICSSIPNPLYVFFSLAGMIGTSFPPSFKALLSSGVFGCLTFLFFFFFRFSPVASATLGSVSFTGVDSAGSFPFSSFFLDFFLDLFFFDFFLGFFSVDSLASVASSDSSSSFFLLFFLSDASNMSVVSFTDFRSHGAVFELLPGAADDAW